MARRKADDNPRSIRAKRILEARAEVGPAVADQLNPPPGTVKTRREQDRATFWHRSLTPEQEAALWQDPAMDIIKASQAIYKRRWQAFALTRPTLPEQVKWIEEMIKLGPPDEDEPMTEDDVPSMEVEMQTPDGAPPAYGY